MDRRRRTRTRRPAGSVTRGCDPGPDRCPGRCSCSARPAHEVPQVDELEPAPVGARFEHPDRVREVEVVEVTEHDDAGAALGVLQPLNPGVDDAGLPAHRVVHTAAALDLARAVRLLEASEQRRVAALGGEVVRDQEQLLAAVAELARQRLAARVPHPVGRIDPARAERQLRARLRGSSSVAVTAVPPGRSTNWTRSGLNRNPTRMLAFGAPPSALCTGSICRYS